MDTDTACSSFALPYRPDELDANDTLMAAAEHYRGAYSCWAAFYDLLGHGVPDAVQKVPARRQAGSAVVAAWLAHEEAALAEVAAALAAV